MNGKFAIKRDFISNHLLKNLKKVIEKVSSIFIILMTIIGRKIYHSILMVLTIRLGSFHGHLEDHTITIIKRRQPTIKFKTQRAS